jgi:hypothetical protein
MTSVLLDVRQAVRVLINNLSATFVAVFTLALAIGATTARRATDADQMDALRQQ